MAHRFRQPLHALGSVMVFGATAAFRYQGDVTVRRTRYSMCGVYVLGCAGCPAGIFNAIDLYSGNKQLESP
jgi:hypothetical protein